MATDMNLQFIREKISQIRTAVMYSMSNSLIRLPNGIVSAVKVDEEGQLWFVSRGPVPVMKEYEQSFPARLCFYRKGVEYSLEVSGKAEIVNNKYSTNPNANEKSLLIKMSMMNIEYREPNAKRAKNKLEMFLESGYKWFLRTAAINRSGSESVLAKLHQTNYYGNQHTA